LCAHVSRPPQDLRSYSSRCGWGKLQSVSIVTKKSVFLMFFYGNVDTGFRRYDKNTGFHALVVL
jgi:hypothetical protein